LQRKAPIGKWFKKNIKIKKADIEYPFEHGEDINDTLDGVSIHPVTTKTQTSFPTQLPERKETAQGFHHEANGDIKTVQNIMAVIGEKLGMDQQHLIMLWACLSTAREFF
jgi:hypothetical protein